MLVAVELIQYRRFWKKEETAWPVLVNRIKVGGILVDAKGASKLYGKQAGMGPVLHVVLAAVFPC